MDEYENFEEIPSDSSPKKNGSAKLLIILLTVIIVLLGGALGLLHFKEKQEIARALNKAENAQTAFIAKQKAFEMNEKSVVTHVKTQPHRRATALDKNDWRS